MSVRFVLRAIWAGLAAAILALPAHAQVDYASGVQVNSPTFTPSRDDWGEYGLLQTPTARVGADGDFAFTFSHEHPYDHYALSATPLPWLEAGFLYTATTNVPYNAQVTSSSEKHMTPVIQFRLVRESADWPEISLGLRDYAGTAAFGGEYLVASRRYYDFDFSAGLGWGYLANRAVFPNPFGVFGNTFKNRPQPSSTTGNFTLDYFRGRNVGLLGGVEWHTPINGVRLKLELDPNNYQNEPFGNKFSDPSPINVGVAYSPEPFLDLSAGLERGNTVMLRVTLATNFNGLGLFRDTTPPPTLRPRPWPAAPAGRPLAEEAPPARDEGAAPVPLAPTAMAADAVPRQADASVDRLYAVADRLGYQLTDVAIDGDVATLKVGAAPGADPGASAALMRVAATDLGVERAVIEPTGPARAVIDAPAPPSEESVARRVFADLKKNGFLGINFAMRGGHVWVGFAQAKYHILTIAMGRAARIVANDVPANVEFITLDSIESGLTVSSVTIDRRDLENAVEDRGSPEEIMTHAVLAGSDPDRPPGIVNAPAYPNFDWGINPRSRQEIGGPTFYVYQLYAELAGTATLRPGFSLDGAIGVNIANNFYSLTPNPNSLLPHVRSDIAYYLKKGSTGIFRAEADYLANLAPDWYGRVSAGLLEEMYAGVDTEVLYRPYQQRLAIGLDVNHVIKRGYDELLDLQNYQVTEGQLSFYYKLPFDNLTATLRVGRYLAGDKGATIEVSRVFDSGVRAGVFATKTNVSAAEFGEGSFDKGFFISFPLDLLLETPSRDEADYVVRPLTRDGGQYLNISKPLYGLTTQYDPETLSKMWPYLLQ